MGSQKGSRQVQNIRHDAASTTIPSASFVEIEASLDSDSNHIDIFNTTGAEVILGIGEAGSEQEVLRVFPSGIDHQSLILNEKMRLAAKAVVTDITTGILSINLKL